MLTASAGNRTPLLISINPPPTNIAIQTRNLKVHCIVLLSKTILNYNAIIKTPCIKISVSHNFIIMLLSKLMLKDLLISLNNFT